ncbi:hypothetical protein [Caldiplasma sukawensis]
MTSIFLNGTGNVGKNLIKMLPEHNIKVAGIKNSRGCLIKEDFLTINEIENFLKHSENYQSEKIFSTEYDIFVDLSTASIDGRRELKNYTEAFSNGKKVVTANKSGLANHWSKIMENGKGRILYEATVAGGLPVFNFKKSCLRYGNIKRIEGIVNLTSNFIVKNMMRGKTKEESIELAKKEGVAETDPSDDISGLDSARKAVLLANHFFNTSISINEIEYGGIENEKIREGDALVVSVAKEKDEIEIFSGLKNYERNHPFTTLDPMGMIITFYFSDRAPVTVMENRDGPLETAAAVLNDILEII